MSTYTQKGIRGFQNPKGFCGDYTNCGLIMPQKIINYTMVNADIEIKE